MPLLSLLRPTALAAALLGHWGGPAAAHEFWIEPETHQVDVGTPVRADLRVGQMLSGEPYPYLSDQIIAAQVHGPIGVVDIDGMEGDLPALAVTFSEPGLHVIAYHAAPNYVVFEDLPTFGEYLVYEGLGDVAKLHESRALPTTEIAEEYIRNARALVQVGPADPAHVDRPTGMPLEFVALQNPFLEGTSEVEVQLLWRGDPVADRQVSIFRKPGPGMPSGKPTRSLTTTDAEGRATIPLGEGGFYLLNAVHIEPASGPGSVVWQSHWASLTFTVDAS